MEITTQGLRAALEMLYWVAALIFVLLMYLRFDRPQVLTREVRDFQRGLLDGQQFRTAGGTVRQLDTLVDDERARGRHAYAGGLAQSLWVQP